MSYINFLTVDPEALPRDMLVACVHDLQGRIEDLHAVPETFLRDVCDGLGLRRGEAHILRALMCGRVLSRASLLALAQGRDLADGPALKTVDVQICRLRKRLGPIGVSITTVWGEGFKLLEPDIARLNDWLRHQGQHHV